MTDDDRTLGSVVGDDEQLRETWTVAAVQRGWPRSPPQFGGTQRLGLTDRRLLWFDADLDSVPLATIESVETDAVRHRSAPRIVRIGSGLMVAGLLATVVATVLSLAALTVTLLPVVLGVAAFVATLVYARASAQSGEERVQHRLRVDDGGERVSVWADEDVVSAIEDAVETE